MKLGAVLDVLGKALLYFSIGLAAAGFLIVLIAGQWPGWLEPVRMRLELGSNLLGPFWWPVLVGIVVGPGLALQSIAENLRRKNHS
ncbi:MULTISPECIES: hypothetical protein [Hyphobacterium]|uniref:Integrase n=1 Tax=Hyphobacterium vulgare TaxID=1736751 RepID=A0ABV6ZWH2_9PROT